MKKKKNCPYIGGQAVMQGVMMRGKRGMATAVRDSAGEIQMEAKRIKPPEKRSVWTKIPFIRGVVNFVSSLVVGMGALLRSSEVAFAEEEESHTKLEKFMAEKWKISLSGVLTVAAVVIGVLLALVLFMYLPQKFTSLISGALPDYVPENSIWYNLIEGGFRLIIFVCYILLTLISKSVRDTYCYHGAEHKTISCYEYGMPLTKENVKKCSRVHDRCGTTFMFFVMLISIVVFSLANFLVVQNWMHTGIAPLDFAIRFLLKLLLLPVVAGISYELLKLLSKTQSPLVLPLKAPGLLLQLLTTREPNDEMIECAIAAFEKVLDMDSDPESPEKTFATETKLSKLSALMKKQFAQKQIDESDAEWILSLTLGVPRSKLAEVRVVTRNECRKVLDIFEERLTGKPLWYIFGDTEFYGYKIKVDERVLIPRPETELLVQQAIRTVEEGDKVLDLCTGSGAIAIALACEAAKDKNISVTAADISEDALEVARENARYNKANVTFVKSDLFDSVRGRFNLITANPPYIKTEDIPALQREVRDHEPHIALDGGKDGLDFYRRIAEKLTRYLVHGGMLIMEVGEDQAQDVLKIFSKCDYAMVVKDLEGKERIVKIVV